MTIYKERVEFVGKNHHNNVSILLWNITFEDGGFYTCFGRNPKERSKNHSAIFHLIVVDERKCQKMFYLAHGLLIKQSHNCLSMFLSSTL